MNDTKAFTLITNARVLVPERRDTPLADILIEGDEIAEIGGTLSAPDTATVIDGTDRLVIPGLINAHTHGHGALHKGAADRWTLELLINAGPWISANRSTEHKYLSALIAAAEMLLKGCTAAYDLYVEIPVPTVEGVTAVGSAYRDAGMRAVVAPMLADRSFFEAIPDLVDAMPAGLKEKTARITMAPLSESMATARNLLTQWSLDREWVRPAIAPTIPLHCSDEYLLASQQLAAEFDVGLHTHLAESKIQALAGIKRYGKTLTAHLDEIGFLGPNFTRRPCGVAGWRRHKTHGRQRCVGRAQSGQQYAFGLWDRGGQGDAGYRGQRGGRDRRGTLLGQSEHVRGDATWIVRFTSSIARL